MTIPPAYGSSPRYSTDFFGRDLNPGVTSVEMMGSPVNDIGIPVARAVRTGNVAVKYERAAGAPPGDWTLRLFKNGVEVATFAVNTT